jgi:hypothetical protein
LRQLHEQVEATPSLPSRPNPFLSPIKSIKACSIIEQTSQHVNYFDAVSYAIAERTLQKSHATAALWGQSVDFR